MVANDEVLRDFPLKITRLLALGSPHLPLSGDCLQPLRLHEIKQLE